VHCIEFPSDPDYPSFIAETLTADSAPPLAPLGWQSEDLARICKVLRRLAELRVRNVADAEDLVQDTLLTMVEKSAELPLRKGLLVWGMGILRKKIGNHYRKTQRRALTGSGDVPRPAGAPTPEAMLHCEELQQIVARVLDRFPPEERRVMRLVLAGMPIFEVAELVETAPYQTIVNYSFRGRRKLVQHLERCGYSRRRGLKV
jgi:RNA polymerase sigma-70 factor (ECF subfamily)